jgi:hypothetical protein
VSGPRRLLDARLRKLLKDAAEESGRRGEDSEEFVERMGVAVAKVTSNAAHSLADELYRRGKEATLAEWAELRSGFENRLQETWRESLALQWNLVKSLIAMNAPGQCKNKILSSKP